MRDWGDSETLLSQCSLQSLTIVMEEFGYQMIQVEYFHATFKHKSIAIPELDQVIQSKSVMEHWLDGWYCAPLATVGGGRLESRFFYADSKRIYGEARHWLTNYSLEFLPHLVEELLEGATSKKGSDNNRAAIDRYSRFPDLYRILVRKLAAPSLFQMNPAPGVEQLLLESGRGRCMNRDTEKPQDPVTNPRICECFVPYRGILCDEEDRRSKWLDSNVETNPNNKGVIWYVVDGEEEHRWELKFALENLWDKFNKYHDYPVIIWHIGLLTSFEIKDFRDRGGLSKLIERNSPAEVEVIKEGSSEHKKITNMEDSEVLDHIRRLSHWGLESDKQERVIVLDARRAGKKANDLDRQTQELINELGGGVGSRQYGPVKGQDHLSRARGTAARNQRVDFGEGGNKSKDKLSILDVISASKNRVWLHFFERPKWRSELKRDRDSHHRSESWVEMIRQKAGPLFLNDAMKRFKYSWCLDTDSYFPKDVGAFDPFEDMEQKGKQLREDVRKRIEEEAGGERAAFEEGEKEKLEEAVVQKPKL